MILETSLIIVPICSSIVLLFRFVCMLTVIEVVATLQATIDRIRVAVQENNRVVTSVEVKSGRVVYRGS